MQSGGQIPHSTPPPGPTQCAKAPCGLAPHTVALLAEHGAGIADVDFWGHDGAEKASQSPPCRSKLDPVIEKHPKPREVQCSREEGSSAKHVLGWMAKLKAGPALRGAVNPRSLALIVDLCDGFVAAVPRLVEYCNRHACARSIVLYEALQIYLPAVNEQWKRKPLSEFPLVCIAAVCLAMSAKALIQDVFLAQGAGHGQHSVLRQIAVHHGHTALRHLTPASMLQLELHLLAHATRPFGIGRSAASLLWNSYSHSQEISTLSLSTETTAVGNEPLRIGLTPTELHSLLLEHARKPEVFGRSGPRRSAHDT